MANGNYYNSPIFNYTMPNTRRRFTSVKKGTGFYEITLPTTVMGTAFPAPVGGIVWIRFSGQSWFNGYWRVRYKSGAVIRLDKQGTGETLPTRAAFVPPLSSQIWWVDAYGSETSPTEIRRLSLFKYDTALKATTKPYTMCGIQNRIYTFLRSSFYADPEIQREYRARYASNSAAWDSCGYGPLGDFALDKVVNHFMCTAFEASHSQDANGFTCWDKNKVVDDGDYVYRGIWQISEINANVGAPNAAGWWPSSGNEELLFIPEYNTRAAAWAMFKRLFDTDNGDDAAANKPFVEWPQSQDNGDNVLYHLCQMSTTSNRVGTCCPGTGNSTQ